MFGRLKRDIQAVQKWDPVDRGHLDEFIYYSGFQAIQMHSLAHFPYRQRQAVVAVQPFSYPDRDSSGGVNRRGFSLM